MLSERKISNSLALTILIILAILRMVLWNLSFQFDWISPFPIVIDICVGLFLGYFSIIFFNKKEHLFPFSFFVAIICYSILIVLSVPFRSLISYHQTVTSYYLYPGIASASHLQINLDSVSGDFVNLFLSEIFFCFAIAFAFSINSDSLSYFFTTYDKPITFDPPPTESSKKIFIGLMIILLFVSFYLFSWLSWSYSIADLSKSLVAFTTLAFTFAVSIPVNKRVYLVKKIFWASLIIQFTIALVAMLFIRKPPDSMTIGLVCYYFFLFVTRSGLFIAFLLLHFYWFKANYKPPKVSDENSTELEDEHTP